MYEKSYIIYEEVFYEHYLSFGTLYKGSHCE